MFVRYDFESNIRSNMVKHRESNAGEDDMRVIRYDRRTEEVGKRASGVREARESLHRRGA